METRSLFDSSGNPIGSLALPDGTSEEMWAEQLAKFSITNQEKINRSLDFSIKAKKDYAENMLERFKKKNLADGINASQGFWLQELMAEYKFTFAGVARQLDIMNLAVSGDIELACLALMYGPADDMSQPYHWLTAERKAWLVNDMKNFLGWA